MAQTQDRRVNLNRFLHTNPPVIGLETPKCNFHLKMEILHGKDDTIVKVMKLARILKGEKPNQFFCCA